MKLDETTVYSGSGPVCKRAAGGFSRTPALKIRETRNLVMPQFCRQKKAAKGATWRGAGFVGGPALVETLGPRTKAEYPYGLRADAAYEIGATAGVVTQQNCAR